MPRQDNRRTVNQLFGQMIMKGHNGSIPAKLLTESAGELKISMLGKAGSTMTNIKVETTGEQDIVLHGKDAGSNIDALLTDASRALVINLEGGSTRKVLARADLAATTSTDVYTVPASTSAEVTSIHICNRNATPITLRVALTDGAVAVTDYIYYGFPLQAYGTLVLGEPFQLDADARVTLYSDTANVSVVITGKEFA